MLNLLAERCVRPPQPRADLVGLDAARRRDLGIAQPAVPQGEQLRGRPGHPREGRAHFVRALTFERRILGIDRVGARIEIDALARGPARA